MHLKTIYSDKTGYVYTTVSVSITHARRRVPVPQAAFGDRNQSMIVHTTHFKLALLIKKEYLHVHCTHLHKRIAGIYTGNKCIERHHKFYIQSEHQ